MNWAQIFIQSLKIKLSVVSIKSTPTTKLRISLMGCQNQEAKKLNLRLQT